jgi:hypothetical protein
MAREVDRGDMGSARSIANLGGDYSRYSAGRDIMPASSRNPLRPLPPRQRPRQYRGQYRTVSR